MQWQAAARVAAGGVAAAALFCLGRRCSREPQGPSRSTTPDDEATVSASSSPRGALRRIPPRRSEPAGSPRAKAAVAALPESPRGGLFPVGIALGAVRGCLLAELGRGAYGVVYRGEIAGAPMALKVAVTDSSDIARLQELRCLRHPCLAGVEDSGVPEGALGSIARAALGERAQGRPVVWLLMPLGGRCLSAVLDGMLQQETRPAPVTTYTWCVDLARAVSYLHSQGWCHLDVKPANALVTDSSLQLCDMDDAARIGAPGGGKWTVAYLEPSILMGLAGLPVAFPHAPTSPHRDIWAVGVVLHQIVTGGGYPAGIPASYAAAMADRWQPPTRSRWAPALAALCERCFLPAEQRISARELRKELLVNRQRWVLALEADERYRPAIHHHERDVVDWALHMKGNRREP